MLFVCVTSVPFYSTVPWFVHLFMKPHERHLGVFPIFNNYEWTVINIFMGFGVNITRLYSSWDISGMEFWVFGTCALSFVRNEQPWLVWPSYCLRALPVFSWEPGEVPGEERKAGGSFSYIYGPQCLHTLAAHSASASSCTELACACSHPSPRRDFSLLICRAA